MGRAGKGRNGTGRGSSQWEEAHGRWGGRQAVWHKREKTILRYSRQALQARGVMARAWESYLKQQVGKVQLVVEPKGGKQEGPIPAHKNGNGPMKAGRQRYAVVCPVPRQGNSNVCSTGVSSKSVQPKKQARWWVR